MSTLITYMRFQIATGWKTTLFWSIGATIYCGLLTAIYPSVKDAIDISLIPANLRSAFNINDFTQLASFLSSELFGVILPILIPFYGIIALSNVVAGAEERGRLDVLLGNPIPRWNLIVGSMLVTALGLVVVVTVIGTVLTGMAALLDLELPVRVAYRAAFSLWPLALALGSLALALSAILRQRSVAMGAAAAVHFLMFLTNIIARLAPDLSGIRFASAHFYYGNAILDGLWWPGIATLLGATVALTTLAVVMFNRRDIFA